MIRILGLLVLIAGIAFAGNPTAPEVDATSGAAAIALVCGGLLVLRARGKKK